MSQGIWSHKSLRAPPASRPGFSNTHVKWASSSLAPRPLHSLLVLPRAANKLHVTPPVSFPVALLPSPLLCHPSVAAVRAFYLLLCLGGLVLVHISKLTD